MKALDEKNKQLKKIYTKKSMKNDLLIKALGKKWEAISAKIDGPVDREIQIRKHSVCVPDFQH